MMVLVRWCYNVDCHSVGRVPSSYPRGVRRPTALLWFYPIPFLFVVSVCPGSLGNIRFGLLVSCSFSLSLMPLLFVSPCVAWSRFLFRPPFMFMYCVKVFCVIFFLGFRFTFLPLSPVPVCSLSFLFPLVRCTSLGSLCLCSDCSLLSCFSVCVLFRPSSA